MGRGSSGAGGGGGGGGGAKTPSGVTLDEFQQMDEQQQVDTIDRILADSSIVVPGYLDNSDTSKVMYALGANGKPDVVPDSAFDALPGRELYRTVYEKGNMPPPSAQDITDQIRYGDYTQMSGRGGSAYGRALYFASSFGESASYGDSYASSKIMRVKIKGNANLAKDSVLRRKLNSSSYAKYGSTDGKALLAISLGYDGWYDSSSGYNMILNRSCLVASDTSKSIYSKGTSKRATGWRNTASNWAGARDS